MNWYSTIYDPETRTAHVMLHDGIGCGGQTSGSLAQELAALSPKKIELQIDSSGGNSITGINLNEIFRRYPTEVLITGQCYSAALSAAMAGRTIRIFPTAKILIHSPANYVFGTADELFDAAIEVEQLRRSVATILCERTKQTAQIVCGWLSCDTWFTAAQAVEFGLADELAIIPPPRPSRPPQASPGLPMPLAETAAEKVFAEWLCAFGPLEVSNREKFGQKLSQWFTSNVIETEQSPNPQQKLCQSMKKRFISA